MCFFHIHIQNEFYIVRLICAHRAIGDISEGNVLHFCWELNGNELTNSCLHTSEDNVTAVIQ